MFRARTVVAVFIVYTLTGACWAQQSGNSASAACNLEDGRQVRINYNAVTAKSDKPANGRPWAPGGAPMTLFTEAPLGFGGATIPIGAFTVYPIPGKDKWTLAVNKNVSPGTSYDEKQDIGRTAMETDPIPDAAGALEVAFAHVGLRCTLRIYFGKIAAFADFVAK
jgi:hypothetical protein